MTTLRHANALVPARHVIVLAAIFVLLAAPGAGRAEWSATSTWQKLGRWSGFGWSDGYHAVSAPPAVVDTWDSAPRAHHPWSAMSHHSVSTLHPVPSAGAPPQWVPRPETHMPSAGLIPKIGHSSVHRAASRDPLPFVPPGVDPDEVTRPSVHNWLRTALSGR